MPRKFKRDQLRQVKEALHKQVEEEISIQEQEQEEAEEKLSKDDVKKMFKESAEPDEIKPSKRKQLNKTRKNLRKQKVIPQKTVAWQHEVGDLVHIPKKANHVDDDGYGIIVQMTDPEAYNETKMRDSRSLVFSPVGRSWYYTKNLRKV
jgi:hypothetical protein